MLRALLLFAALIQPSVVFAQSEAESLARNAAAALEAAAQLLDASDGARDRVRALTQTIQAYEVGMSAMRTGLRQAALNEAQLSARLAAREEEVAEFLSALQSVGTQASPTSFLHPEGPLGTARAGMLLAELTPALNRRADALRRDLENVQTLRALQEDASRRLGTALTEVIAARTALNQAMADRTDLPRRFTSDPERLSSLIASTETLEGFASGLSEIVTEVITPAATDLDGDIGELPLPVRGLILRRANEPDAAGVVRPGIILATRSGAIVTSPTAATIRYAGALLDLGQVIILEPQADTLFIFAGLDVVYGAAGEVIAGGTPLGLMGGAMPQSADSLSPLREDTGTESSETLYIEVRRNNTPEDPEAWFRTDKDR